MLLLILLVRPELGIPGANGSVGTCVVTLIGAFVGRFDSTTALASDGATDDDNEG